MVRVTGGDFKILVRVIILLIVSLRLLLCGMIGGAC